MARTRTTRTPDGLHGPAGLHHALPAGVAGVDARVMGTDVLVLVRGSAGARAAAATAERCLDGLRALERRWSRFLADSELSRMNRLAGRPTVVSGDTALLVSLACEAAALTGGRFDPTVLAAVIANGYDRDLSRLPDVVGAFDPAPAPGASGITVDATSGLVWTPPSVGIDPGGIGKGLAADLVATAAVEDGAAGVLVDVGGDLRVVGSPPPDGWEVRVEHGSGHHDQAAVAGANLRSGALATSSVLRRRWRSTDGERHHVVDPRTGRPSDGPFASVTVLAATAWWAEVVATALLVDPSTELARPDAPLLDGVGVLASADDGSQHRLGPLSDSFGPVAQGHAETSRHPDGGGSA